MMGNRLSLVTLIFPLDIVFIFICLTLISWQMNRQTVCHGPKTDEMAPVKVKVGVEVNIVAENAGARRI